MSKAYLFYYPRDNNEDRIKFFKLQQQNTGLPGEGVVQAVSPISTPLYPVYSYSGLPRNKALLTIPSRATTHSAPHQGANTARSKAALERPRRPGPSVAASQLPTRDEAPRVPRRTFGAAAEGRNVTTTRRKGRQGSFQARPRPSPTRPGP